MDTVRKIYKHLKVLKPGKTDIDLFLHSNGGESTVPWRLVTLIREYAKQFRVLIPHRAFSAATLTAMGADEVVMGPMAMLGPTDPTVTNPFNPVDPTSPPNRIGISVEDVTAYLALVREDAGIREEKNTLEAFRALTNSVHPLALGNVKRHLSLSRLMAKKLLGLHMDEKTDKHRIQKIIDNFTSKLFFHGHPINRHEAVEQVGLSTVKDAKGELEELMWNLYSEYEQEMKMEEPFRADMEFLTHFPNLPLPQAPMPGAPLAPAVPSITPLETTVIAAVESVNYSDVFTVDYEISGEKLPTGAINVSMIIRRQGWVSI
jgi:hypothetical protein